MGAWIEILNLSSWFVIGNVAPYMGAWIEIWRKTDLTLKNWGRTLYGCVDWNKQLIYFRLRFARVAPYMGAWIEITAPYSR